MSCALLSPCLHPLSCLTYFVVRPYYNRFLRKKETFTDKGSWGNVSEPGARRASFVTRAPPVDCCR